MNSAIIPLSNSELTERELEVARLISLGYTDKEIATELFLSVHTVRSHHKNIFRKLMVHNIAAMVMELHDRNQLNRHYAQLAVSQNTAFAGLRNSK